MVTIRVDIEIDKDGKAQARLRDAESSADNESYGLTRDNATMMEKTRKNIPGPTKAAR